MWNRTIRTRTGLLVVGLVVLPLLAALVIPRFPKSRGHDPAVLATMRVLAEVALGTPKTPSRDDARAPLSPRMVVPEAGRYCYRLQWTADGLVVQAWPMRFEPGDPNVYRLDPDGTLWTKRDPSGGWVGLDRAMSPLSGSIDPAAPRSPPDSVRDPVEWQRDHRIDRFGVTWSRMELR